MALWYVRPSGTSIGGDGTGAAVGTAWDGFASIAWASINPLDTLYLIGQYSEEQLVIQAAGIADNYIFIVGDPVDGPVTLTTATLLTSLLALNQRDWIDISGIEAIGANGSCFDFRSCQNIIGRNLKGRNSTNQAFQHQDVLAGTRPCIMQYYDIEGTGCTDDGFSSHEASIIDIQGGKFNNNAQGIQVIHDTQLTGDNIECLNNSGQDIVASTATTQGSATIDLTNVRFNGVVRPCHNVAGLGGVVTIDGFSCIPKPGLAEPVIQTQANGQIGDITLSNGKIIGVTGGNVGIDVRAGTTATLDNVEVLGFGGAGIGIDQAGGSTINATNIGLKYCATGWQAAATHAETISGICTLGNGADFNWADGTPPAPTVCQITDLSYTEAYVADPTAGDTLDGTEVLGFTDDPAADKAMTLAQFKAYSEAP